MNKNSTEKLFNTAILFLVFNRIDTTKRVFQAIRDIKPTRIYLAADGPRSTHEEDQDRVAEVVAYVLEHIDWKCDVTTLIRKENLGCKRAVSEAIDWFFSHESDGIILEDDCLPDPTFFRFCEELLEYYRGDTRVGMISGDNFQFGQRHGDASYYFSRIAHIWGWATWAHAWKAYDREMAVWPNFSKGKWLNGLVSSRDERRYWENIFNLVASGKIDTWDYQWVLSCLTNGMLVIMPNVNLVSNIGFGSSATHTTDSGVYDNAEVGQMTFPLMHPAVILPCLLADANTAKRDFRTRFSVSRIYQKLQQLIF